MADEKKSTFKDKLHAFWTVVKKYAKRVWAYLKVAKMEYIVMVSLFALDLISKAIINATMDVGDTVVVIPYVLQFHNLHNTGAAFGSSWIKSWLGPLGSRIFFCVFAVAASVIFILVLIRHKGGNRLFRVALAMIVAGAMGNCIDRWALGFVRDFVELVYFGLTIGGRDSFYVFNLADAELVVGVILIVVYFIFIYKDKSSERKHALLLEREAMTSSGVSSTETESSSSEDKAQDSESVEGDAVSGNGRDAQSAETAQATETAEAEAQADDEPVEKSESGGGAD